MLKKSIIISLFFICFQFASPGQAIRHLEFDLGVLQNYGGFFKLYSGIIEAGGVYNLGLTRDLFAGVAMHAGVLNRKNAEQNAIFYKPAFQLSYNIHLSERVAIIPAASIGYTWVSIRNDSYNYKEAQSGLNTGVDLKVLWKTQERTDFYIFGRYDYVFLDEDNEFTELFHYRKIHQTAFGFGIRIK